MVQQENAGVGTDVKQQVMMTLAGLASTAQNTLPGELPDQQTARIQKGIETQLAMTSLATAGQWTLKWVQQSGFGFNMAYIAQNAAASAFAVVFRGTVNLFNFMEDYDVATPEDFLGGAQYGKVSHGSNVAFAAITNDTNLASTLQGFVKESSGPQTVYVVGHSLGGAMATMFSLYLRDQLNGYGCTVQCYTFAAPSAGDSKFATSFNNQQPAPVCVWNAYDVVPHAWAALETVRDTFYPLPGLAASKDMKQQIQSAIDKANGVGTHSQYTQVAQQPPLNTNLSIYFTDSRHVLRNDEAMADAYWKEEMAYQHGANTYLELLGLSEQQQLPNPPVATSVSPNNGHMNDLLTITGKNFSQDCKVRFYFLIGFGDATDVTVKDDKTITCKAPFGIGGAVADVRVINCAGASDQSAATQFKFD
ncbi:IPT/TIG domain-containing protein [Sorangium sp. So ce185]|uniref:lipase family protein n=1 Tax=Sorangium sp. So ce185 TaxID=3133287 RepID=UPI003F627553